VNSRYQQYVARALGILLGFLILYVVYRMLASKRHLLEYEQSFSQVQHPQDTSLVDSLAIIVEYYPATYADDNIEFKHAYLAGEFRRYDGDWSDIAAFYEDKNLENRLTIVKNVSAIPVEINNGKYIWAATANGYVPTPFAADILSNIQDHYRLRGIPQNLIETGQSLYFVYSIWLPENSPTR
jgi:hypothetical protein